jgi:hypothetical protein
MPHGVNANGKYLRIEVPNFNDAKNGEGAMTSYLHLGAVWEPSYAASPSAPKGTGEDLAARVTSFIDDDRVRDGCPDFVPVAERQAETAKLHTKGGWRDHSDGNRITTTRGDKVEVIKGNYRMVVLGRREDLAEWDVSGGHVYENGITFPGSSVVEYTTEEYGGTWKVTERVEKGDVTSFYHGKVRDTYAGEEITSTTGSESPTPERANPVITDRTWAERLESYTGSAAWPVPSISDETWAGTITSTTNAGAVTDTTTVSGAITSTTTAASVVDTTTAALVASTTVGNVMDTTIGTSTSLMVGAEMETIIGNSMEINVGAQESLTVGGVVDVTLGAKLDVTIAGKVSVDIGPSVDVSIGPRVEIKVMRNHVEATVTKMNGEEVKLSAAYTLASPLTMFL